MPKELKLYSEEEEVFGISDIDAFVNKWISEHIGWHPAYLVKLNAWYSHQKEDPDMMENCLLLWEPGFQGSWHLAWDIDWYEGQQNVTIYAIYGIDDLDLQDNV